MLLTMKSSDPFLSEAASSFGLCLFLLFYVAFSEAQSWMKEVQSQDSEYHHCTLERNEKSLVPNQVTSPAFSQLDDSED